MHRKIVLAALAVVCISGCYRVTVNTGATPAPKTIEKAWAFSFIYGLVPPAEIASKTECPQGVASVVTERSFLNGLVSNITYGILTPIHVTVTCAAGR